MSRLTTEDAAYAAASWASGTTQTVLARQFKVNGPSVISVAINKFLQAYARHKPGRKNWARKELVPSAIAAFRSERDANVVPMPRRVTGGAWTHR